MIPAASLSGSGFQPSQHSEVKLQITVKTIATFVLIAATMGWNYGCGGGGAGGGLATPSITSMSPNSVGAGSAPFGLTVFGANFVSGAVINFGGTARSATFQDATRLETSIPAAAVASTGTLTVTVTNPNGVTSNAVNFTTTSGPNPIPTINSLSPGCAPAGGESFSLFVDGTNFVASSVVRWNGSDLPTTVFSASGVQAHIPVSDVSVAATAAVTAFNPSPGGGSSTTVTFTVTSGGVNPQSITVDPTGKFAYVADTGCFDGNVSMYTINPTTGTLTTIAPPVDSGDEGAQSVTLDPSGKFVYVANWGEGDTAGSISMFSINSTTGALTSAGRGIIGTCGSGLCSPWSITVHPSGKFAYVANEGGIAPTAVSMFTINGTTGALTSIGNISAGGRAIAVAVDPSGKFAYVATQSSPLGSIGRVSMYTINASTGMLTSAGTIGAGTNPVSVAVDPTGKFAYVANSGSNDVSMYSIDTTTGILSSLGPIVGATSPSSVTVDPSGKFVYVANSGSNNVSMYSINATTGVLTFIGVIAAGTSPSSIAIHPSGKFVYVTNSGSNNVSIYSIDATTGLLTLRGTIGT